MTDKVTEGLGQFKVLRHRLMRLARVADEVHAIEAHAGLMYAVLALDDAEEAFKQTTGHRRLMEDCFEVHHLDHNPLNNDPMNLELVPGGFTHTAQEIADLPELEEL